LKTDGDVYSSLLHRLPYYGVEVQIRSIPGAGSEDLVAGFWVIDAVPSAVEPTTWGTIKATC
jgi:hypothetical protein